MRIDKTHRPWLTATVILFGVATLGYLAYAFTSQTGPSGGSLVGLIYGIAGYLMMLFAGLLGARKKVPVWRLGRAQTWMRGHLWLGLLSLPVILFHAGFVWKGPLTEVLMILFFIVWLSGIAGAAIQHYMPHVILSRVQMETIYEEIPHVRRQLRDEADQLVASICGPIAGMTEDKTSKIKGGGSARADQVVATTVLEVELEDKGRLKEMYLGTIRPFLENPESAGAELASSSKADAVFQSLYRMLPTTVHPMIEDLESICDEERQLTQQRRYYHVLHGWLLAHVPLSIALLVLGGIHAIVALQY
jgi:hypothetical protein